ncbi:MAG: hypothetical protein M1167_05200 [Chloroflexi bacterium]|nr:hypothetical protein [Chloroflexota bacterium]
MKPNKTFPLLIIFILATSGAFMAIPLSAAANPSVPEFTVQYIDRSYDVPPTYGTDPYTGKTIMTSGGSHVDNQTIDVTIQNQPFTPYKDASNQTVYLYYNVRSKGHFEDWTTASSGFHSQSGIQASPGSYTLVTFFIQYWDISPGGQVDFQVQAVLSYTTNSYSGSCFTGSQTTTVAQSDWSNTATITIGDTTPTSAPSWPTQEPLPTNSWPNPTATTPPYQNPTATPTQPGAQKPVLFGVDFDWEQTALIVMAVIIACFVVVVAVLLRKVVAKKAVVTL